MNYYSFHIGDYAVHTRHLSPMEDLAYRRLLDLYYTREGALPPDTLVIARLLGMKDHYPEVENVLCEFFLQNEDGWSHERCDEEIAKYLEAEPDRQARRENERERQRRSRERRKELFDLLRAAGQVPAFDTPMHTLQAMVDGVTSQPVTRDDTLHTDRATGTQYQEPITNTSKEKRGPSAPRARRCPDGWAPPQDALDAMTSECPGVDLARETAQFRDWEFKDPKTDWPAAWRRWIRKAATDLRDKPTGETNYARSMREKYEQVTPLIAAKTGPRPNPLDVIEGMTREPIRIAR